MADTNAVDTNAVDTNAVDTNAARICQFLLAPTNLTQQLALTEPPWGTPFTDSLPLGGALRLDPPLPHLGKHQNTHWRALPHALIHTLAHHPSRVTEPSSACYCIASALGPPVLDVHSWRKVCDVEHLAEWTHARSWCPRSLPLVVVDNADVDYPSHPLCRELWPTKAMCAADKLPEAACCDKRLGTILRVSGGPPGVARREFASCTKHTLTVPWVAHTRHAAPPAEGRQRRVRTALACGILGHHTADRLGFTPWRAALRDYCHGWANCTRVYVSQSGGASRSAVELYSQSVFCLMPPGDVVARAAIVDAITAGCVPVFFHPTQAQLWPLHWNGSATSVTFDWTSLPLTAANRTNLRAALHPYAKQALAELRDMPDAQVQRLQRGVREVAPGMVYTRAAQHHDGRVETAAAVAEARAWPDATDTFVRELPALLRERGWLSRRCEEGLRARDRGRVGRASAG